jgi:hypothetical protein
MRRSLLGDRLLLCRSRSAGCIFVMAGTLDVAAAERSSNPGICQNHPDLPKEVFPFKGHAITGNKLKAFEAWFGNYPKLAAACWAVCRLYPFHERNTESTTANPDVNSSSLRNPGFKFLSQISVKESLTHSYPSSWAETILYHYAGKTSISK